MEAEFDVAREVELYNECERRESIEAYSDELEQKLCGDVYIVSAK